MVLCFGVIRVTYFFTFSEKLDRIMRATRYQIIDLWLQ